MFFGVKSSVCCKSDKSFDRFQDHPAKLFCLYCLCYVVLQICSLWKAKVNKNKGPLGLITRIIYLNYVYKTKVLGGDEIVLG